MANHPSQVRRGSVADDPDQPQAGGTSPAAGLGDLSGHCPVCESPMHNNCQGVTLGGLSTTANNIFDLTERLRALKRKPTS